MRKIPVTLNNDQATIIGFLELNDSISDEQLRDMYVSWSYLPAKRQVISVTLIPMLSLPDDGSIRCPNCNQPVMYSSQHARDIPGHPRGVSWACDNRPNDPGIVIHR